MRIQIPVLQFNVITGHTWSWENTHIIHGDLKGVVPWRTVLFFSFSWWFILSVSIYSLTWRLFPRSISLMQKCRLLGMGLSRSAFFSLFLSNAARELWRWRNRPTVCMMLIRLTLQHCSANCHRTTLHCISKVAHLVGIFISGKLRECRNVKTQELHTFWEVNVLCLVHEGERTPWPEVEEKHGARTANLTTGQVFVLS